MIMQDSDKVEIDDKMTLKNKIVEEVDGDSICFKRESVGLGPCF